MKRAPAPVLAGAMAGLTTLSFSPGQALADTPDVVASIVPVHSLVAGVMQGVGQPELLLPAGASPHGYAMRPSDAAALSGADLVFWIGPNMESTLAKPIASLAEKAVSATLENAEGLEQRPYRERALWGEGHDDDHSHDHGHDHEEAHDHHHHHGSNDPHVWLDPGNAAAMTRAIADALVAADPDNAMTYRRNASDQIARLGALDARLAERLQPVQGVPFIVFHDAYHHFEDSYGLTSLGAITLSPDRSPGAQHLREIRELVSDSGAACVFREPQFEPSLVQSLISETGARAGVLDPVGAALEPGPDAYEKLMTELTGALVDCLEG